MPFEKEFHEIIKNLHEFDCLRIGLSGNLGMSSYSTAVEYGLEDILVINNRNELTKYEGFYKVDEYLDNQEFKNLFHYRPQNAVTMDSYLTSK